MTQTFEYSDYDDDFFRSFLRDNADRTPAWIQSELTKYAVTHRDRDSDLEDFLQTNQLVPSIGVSIPAAAPVAMAAFTPLSFTTTDFESTNVFDWVITAPTTIRLLEEGIVDVKGFIFFEGSALGTFRYGGLVQASTGTELAAQTSPPIATNGVRISVSVTVPLDAGDGIQLYENHDTGGNLNIYGKLSMSFLGRTG